MFAPRIAFIDVETTGASPVHGRITEVGVVLAEVDGEHWRIREWATLVQPGMPIPPEISWLTGITNDMVHGAPDFSEIAPTLSSLLEDAVVVAHNARFDHGFLKHEFERAGLRFSAKWLCTVRLSRALYPDAASHGLDAVIARHGLSAEGRHRALGDAKLLWSFVQKMYADHPSHVIEEAVRRLLKRSGWPAQVPPEVLTQIPKAPGVYLFYGMNEHPLYIGKSIHLRERVGSHFTNDYRTERSLRLSQEVVRIEWEQTAGEMSALLRERTLIKERMPAHNVALRRQARQVVLECVPDRFKIGFVPAASLPLPDRPHLYGLFGSRASARAALIQLAREHGLCLKTLGLERGRKDEPPRMPCFGYQVRRCQGCCVGLEETATHWARFLDVLAPLRLPDWPYEGPIALIEQDELRGGQEVHVFDRWCWLATAPTLAEVEDRLRAAPPPRFETDVFHLLQSWLERSNADGIVPLIRTVSPR